MVPPAWRVYLPSRKVAPSPPGWHYLWKLCTGQVCLGVQAPAPGSQSPSGEEQLGSWVESTKGGEWEASQSDFKELCREPCNWRCG